MCIIIVVIARSHFPTSIHTTNSVSTSIPVKYYSDYYIGLIWKNKVQIKFLVINHNKKLSEKFIYSDCKVNCVRKEINILSDDTKKG